MIEPKNEAQKSKPIRNLECIEIDFNNEAHMKLFEAFYYEVYVDGFPDESERESMENIIKQAGYIGDCDEAKYHCIVARVDKVPVGGIIGDYFVKSNCSAIEFLVVTKKYRKCQIGKQLFDFMIGRFYEDALSYGKKSMDYCFFETENPWKLQPTDKAMGINRLNILAKLTTGIVEINYIQPPLEKGKKAVDYLYLGVCVLNQQLSTEVMECTFIKMFLEEYFKYAFGIDKPELCPAYISMIGELERDSIKIIKLEELVASLGN